MRTPISYVLAIMAFLIATRPAPAVELTQLASVGPWPVVSELIGFRGRLWFVNSVKGVNHNSADLYSLDPASGAVRYEHHMFSQDAGEPLVRGGLLYWPYEDPRYSLGWGAIDVTNGTDWRHMPLPGGTTFHVHALEYWQGKLVAAVSAWTTGLRISADGGNSWTSLYRHPIPPEDRLSRLLSLAVAGDTLYARLKDAGGPRLVRWDGHGLVDVPGWPQGRQITGLVAHKGAIFAAVAGPNGSNLWTSDGGTSRALGAPAKAWRVRDLASDGTYLWAVTRTRRGAAVWRSTDGHDWRDYARVPGAVPYALAVLNGQVYVGGGGANGRGALWGELQDDAGMAPGPRPPVGGGGSAMPGDIAGGWQRAGRRLDQALGRVGAYEKHGRAIRDQLFSAVRGGAPPGFFAQRLRAPFPDSTIAMFGGKMRVPARSAGQTLVLWAMGLAGEQGVPVSFLRQTWTQRPNSFEKYIDPLPRALWAVALTGQNDRATIGALIARLGGTGDPLWLRGDAIGALAAVTGERIGADVSGWVTWWKKSRSAWHKQR